MRIVILACDLCSFHANSRALTMDATSSGTWPYFAVPALTLVPPKGTLPDSSVFKQTYDLACASATLAEQQAFSSMLAGPGSESDEFLDIGFWCGEIDEDKVEVSVLSSLTLDQWVTNGTVRLV